ncbi:MAG: enolase C-terminal domain-like protein [Planctomycetaceae bacterium]
MTFRIRSIELYVRETPAGRMAFALGKKGSVDVSQGRISPLGHVRMIVRDTTGNENFGCSADRLSVRWLDKRPGRSLDLKRRELVNLIDQARNIYLNAGEFETPFELWQRCHPRIMKLGAAANQESLTSSFASALFERAVVDACCRLQDLPVFLAVKHGKLGFNPAAIHPSTANLDWAASLPRYPRAEFSIRHTVGSLDPVSASDLPEENRVNDGLPETLEEYIREDGIRFFKVKVSGNVDADLERMAKIWATVSQALEPVITLDANEAYEDLDSFAEFVRRFETEQTGCFQHVEYIEQPLPRALTLDPKTTRKIRAIGESKRLLIDEADGTLDSYRQALDIGYLGTSHKNCKGFFKSLANHALMNRRALDGHQTFLSGEDLQNLPVVPLQQDFATLGILGLEHCERNGHHYNFGLQLLSEKDKLRAVKRHPDLYIKRGNEWFLNIAAGTVECHSIHDSGFGVQDEPDWASMSPMNQWVQHRHPRR